MLFGENLILTFFRKQCAAMKFCNCVVQCNAFVLLVTGMLQSCAGFVTSAVLIFAVVLDVTNFKVNLLYCTHPLLTACGHLTAVTFFFR